MYIFWMLEFNFLFEDNMTVYVETSIEFQNLLRTKKYI